MTAFMETSEAQVVVKLMDRLHEAEASNLRMQQQVDALLGREGRRPPLFIDLSGLKDIDHGPPAFTFSDGWILFWEMETGQCSMSARCTYGEPARPLDEAHSRAVVSVGPLRVRFTPPNEDPKHVVEFGSQATELCLKDLVDAVYTWGLQPCPAGATDMVTNAFGDGMEWPRGSNGEHYAMQWFCGLFYDVSSSLWQLNYTYIQ